MQAIFQPVRHNQKWWYVIPMAPRTKPLFHSLLPQSGQVIDVHNLPIDTDTTSDQKDNNITHSSKVEGTRSWVATQLLHDNEAQIETRSLLDADADDEADPNLATEYNEPTNTDASVDLCIELGSRNMIDMDEDTYIFFTVDIDSFLVIYSYADHNS
jgi:hypothetical protein